MTLGPDDAVRDRSVLDALPVLFLDGSGAPQYASPALSRLAAPAGDPTAEGLDALVAPADADAVAAAFAAVVGGEAAARVAFRGRSDGRAREVVFVNCLADGAAAGVAAFIADSPAPPPSAAASLLERADAADLDTLVTDVLAAAATPAVAFGWYGLDASNATLRAATGSGSAEPPVRAAFAAGETTALDAAAFPLAALSAVSPAGGLAVPVGNRGVLVAAVADGAAVDGPLFDFVATVARVLALGLDRLAWRDAARRSRAVAERSRMRAERLAAVGDTVDRIQRRALRAATGDGVYRALVEGLVADGLAASAVVVEVDAETGALVPQAQAGEDRGYHDRVSLDVATTDPPPAVRAAADRETVTVTDVASGEATTAWRREALACGFRAVLAVPLVVEDVVRGVLGVYLGDAAALDGPLERAVERLAVTAVHAVNALELRTAFLGNATVELRLRLPDADLPLSRLATAAGGSVRFVSATPRSDGATRLFFTAPEDATPLTTADIAGVGEVSRLEERGEEALFVATVPDETVATAFAPLGALLTEANADGRAVDVTLVVSRDRDVRDIVDAVRETFPGAELLARRTRDRPVEATRGFRDAVDERLTGRQLEVLQAAYFGGYFAWPREHSSSDLAVTLDIAQPTFSRHLRIAERKLLSLLFEHDGAGA